MLKMREGVVYKSREGHEDTAEIVIEDGWLTIDRVFCMSPAYTEEFALKLLAMVKCSKRAKRLTSMQERTE